MRLVNICMLTFSIKLKVTPNKIFANCPYLELMQRLMNQLLFMTCLKTWLVKVLLTPGLLPSPYQKGKEFCYRYLVKMPIVSFYNVYIRCSCFCNVAYMVHMHKSVKPGRQIRPGLVEIYFVRKGHLIVFSSFNW